MRVVIGGGSGFLGAALAERLRARGDEVTVLARHAGKAGEVRWTGDPTSTDWFSSVDGADAVVNLAGAGIADKRWTPQRKTAIRDSRVNATRALVAAITSARRKPAVFLSGSAIGIYGPRGDEAVTEETPPGSDFLARVCVDWEREALVAAPFTRVVLLRTGLALHHSGGALPQMAMPFRLFAGGPVGSGRQYMSWIHRDDWVEMVQWSIATAAVAGPLNLSAPNPVPNREFAQVLGRTLGRPAFMPAPALALRLALGEMAEALLTGQRVLPARAQALGFTFRYPRLEDALRAIYRAGSSRP
jgi:uncharacterized protein (TIGR01777 family)